LAQVDLLTAGKQEHTPQQAPGPVIAVTAHLSFIGGHGCDKPHIEASQPHTISYSVDFAQFLSAILACSTETVLV